MNQPKIRRTRRGTALILVVVMIGVFLIIAAASINVAYMQLTRSELRAATDAAARAGAEALARTDSPSQAIQRAIDIAATNKVAGQSLVLDASDISIGHATQKGNSGKWTFHENQTPYSSIRVSSDISSPLLMSGVTGRSTFQPDVVSTAAFSVNEICLVIDRSHSMCFDLSGTDFSYPTGTPIAPPDPVIYPPNATGSRWASLEAAVNVFLASITSANATQRLALVTWGSEITLASYEGGLTGREFPASVVDSPLTTDHSVIQGKILARGDDVMLGGTHMSAGIDMAVEVLTGPDSHNYATKIMVLMTDGKWNMGTNPKQSALDAKKANITIYTVTFLDTADQTDMQQVAKTTGGQHYHASNQAELEDAFRDIARHLPVVLID